MKLKPLKIVSNVAAKTFQKVLLFSLRGLSESKATANKWPPDFFFKFKVLGQKKHGGELYGRMTPLNGLAHGLLHKINGHKAVIYTVGKSIKFVNFK